MVKGSGLVVARATASDIPPRMAWSDDTMRRGCGLAKHEWRADVEGVASSSS